MQLHSHLILLAWHCLLGRHVERQCASLPHSPGLWCSSAALAELGLTWPGLCPGQSTQKVKLGCCFYFLPLFIRPTSTSRVPGGSRGVWSDNVNRVNFKIIPEKYCSCYQASCHLKYCKIVQSFKYIKEFVWTKWLGIILYFLVLFFNFFIFGGTGGVIMKQSHPNCNSCHRFVPTCTEVTLIGYQSPMRRSITAMSGQITSQR